MLQRLRRRAAPHPPFPGSFLAVLALALAMAATSPRQAMGSEAPGLRVVPLKVPGAGAPGFTRVPAETTGVRFTNILSTARSLTNHVLLNGSGVALGDVDGDGRPDLFLCGLDGPNALYRNEGDFRFRDITPPVLAGPDSDATGAAFADLDGDGDLDLLVNVLGRGTRCYRNDGPDGFRDVTETAGTASTAGGTSMALADVDGDGDLDLYVAHYRTSTVRDRFNVRLRMNRVNGALVVTAFEGRPTTDPDLVGRFSVDEAGNLIENGEADTLFLNEGGCRFRPLPFTGGAFLDEDGQPLREPPYDWSLSAMFRDLDHDGWPDLYVCSDMASIDRIWLNQRDGRFRAAPRLALRKTSWFSMGVDFGDLNRDGHDDFLVTDMVSREHLLRQVQISNHKLVPSRPGRFDDRPQAPRNTFFVGLGDGDFVEAAFAAGLEASEWSWAPVFLDVDLDGFEDVLVVTGFERDVQDIDVANELEAARQSRRLGDAEALEMRRRFPPLHQANLLFRNRGDLTFEEVGHRWGFDAIGISQGLALADLDGDGDLDAVVNDMNGPVGIYRNNGTAPRVAVRLKGLAPNTRGVGARLRLLGGAVPAQTQEVIAGGRYLSSDDPLRVFAAGTATHRMRLEVDWRGGRRSVVEDVRANQWIEVDEAAATTLRPPAPPVGAPLFEDVSARLGHTHVEADFDDFARQPLLPRKLSQSGPALAWHDLDRDGWPDVVLGTGRGGRVGLYRNDQRGGFVPFEGGPSLRRTISRDLTGLVVWEAEGAVRLVTGFSNYEGAPDEPASIMQIDPVSGTVNDAVPPIPDEPGPLALADWDGDGDLDLFVGGRLRPGRYPEAATSRLYRRDGGGWIPDEAGSAAFVDLGLVNGAVFADLDADGRPELVLACDWGPVRVFRAAGGGRWSEATRELGFDAFPGWWQGVAAGDFDGDGRLDLVASNWGTNTRHHDPRNHPLHLYYGDFNGGGQVDLFEAYVDPASGRTVPKHHLGRVRAALPFVQARFPTYRAFGAATVAEILAERMVAARDLAVTWLSATVFLNRGSRFEARPLPAFAQLAPSHAVVVADFDGDGREDVFLGQNFFATDPEDDRHDGGRGLLLLGDGGGGFRPASATESGIRVYGEQRAAAAADFDRDGRVDLAVTQNANQTRLFRNAGGRPGLRVRLAGPPGNPRGIGAGVRLDFGEVQGPVREVHVGSGYLSQDDAVIVLAQPRPAQAVVVRWPGGGTSRTPVPSGAAEVEVGVPVR